MGIFFSAADYQRAKRSRQLLRDIDANRAIYEAQMAVDSIVRGLLELRRLGADPDYVEDTARGLLDEIDGIQEFQDRMLDEVGLTPMASIEKSAVLALMLEGRV